MLLIVDDALRFVLYGVSVVLGVDLRANDIERMFAASASGDSLSQVYELYRTAGVVVIARADEHEPESVWLSVTAPGFDQSKLERLVEAAKHASFGLAGARLV